MTLKIILEAGYCVYTGENQPIPEKQDGNWPMTEKKSWGRMRRLEQNLELISVFKEKKQKLIFNFVFE